jgi:hypothetical protein
MNKAPPHLFNLLIRHFELKADVQQGDEVDEVGIILWLVEPPTQEHRTNEYRPERPHIRRVTP